MSYSEAKLREQFERARPDFPKGTPFWRDGSFSAALERCPRFRDVLPYLPADLSVRTFMGQAEIENLWSSYKDHGYGYFIYSLGRILKPVRCVEIGVLQGFSLLTQASALRDNGKGWIKGFDLFEDYPYHHEKLEAVLERIREFGLQRWADIFRLDAFQVHEKFDAVDYLHVDISNNGDVFRAMFAQWANKVTQVMLFEGGSSARDQVGWMVRCQKAPILPAVDEIRGAYPDWTIFVFEPFPSLTVALRNS